MMAPWMPARVANVWFIETRCLEHLREQNGGWCPKGLHDSVGQYLGIEPKRGSQKRAIAAAAYLWFDRARYSVRRISTLRRCASFVNTYIRRSCSGPASSGRLLPYSDFQWTHQTTLFSSWMMIVGSATRSSSLLSSFDMHAVTFGSAAEYMAYPKPDVPSCLVLDVDLPDINGLDLQSQIAPGDHPHDRIHHR